MLTRLSKTTLKPQVVPNQSHFRLQRRLAHQTTLAEAAKTAQLAMTGRVGVEDEAGELAEEDESTSGPALEGEKTPYFTFGRPGASLLLRGLYWGASATTVCGLL